VNVVLKWVVTLSGVLLPLWEGWRRYSSVTVCRTTSSRFVIKWEPLGSCTIDGLKGELSEKLIMVLVKMTPSEGLAGGLSKLRSLYGSPMGNLLKYDRGTLSIAVGPRYGRNSRDLSKSLARMRWLASIGFMYLNTPSRRR
jgi:hypothetical protein